VIVEQGCPVVTLNIEPTAAHPLSAGLTVVEQGITPNNAEPIEPVAEHPLSTGLIITVGHNLPVIVLNIVPTAEHPLSTGIVGIKVSLSLRLKLQVLSPEIQ